MCTCFDCPVRSNSIIPGAPYYPDGILFVIAAFPANFGSPKVQYFTYQVSLSVNLCSSATFCHFFCLKNTTFAFCLSCCTMMQGEMIRKWCKQNGWPLVWALGDDNWNSFVPYRNMTAEKVVLGDHATNHH